MCILLSTSRQGSEGALSDVISSRIESRNVISLFNGIHTRLNAHASAQETEGSEGESECDDTENNKEDELVSDGAEE
jgi:hypothetical protein